ncbi:hypothetical protein ES703_41934 [subsurface metagenome]
MGEWSYASAEVAIKDYFRDFYVSFVGYCFVPR